MPVLHQALSDSSVDVRAAAIDGIGRLKDAGPQAAAELTHLLGDTNPVIRQDAIHGLGALGMPGLPGLITALSDSYSTLSDEAGREIVALGPPAIPSLQAAEQSPDPDLKRKAALLIRRIEQGSPSPARPHRKTRKPS